MRGGLAELTRRVGRYLRRRAHARVEGRARPAGAGAGLRRHGPRRPPRRATALGLALTAVVTAGGCARGDAGTGDGPVTLSLWARSDQAAFMGEIVDSFHRAHRDVRIDLTLIPTGNFVQKLGVAVAGDSGPDLASIDLVYVPFFASSGVLADITERARDLPLDKLSRAHLDQGDYQGRRYALPFTGDSSVLYYNTGLFRRAGLDPDRPPRDWREFHTAAKRISALGKRYHGYHFSGRCGGCNVFTFAPFVWASGGRLLTGPPGEEKPVVGSDPEVRRALELYRTLWREKLVPPQAAADTGAHGMTLFGSGTIGMYATGAFGYSEMRRSYPDVDFRVAPIPGRDGGSAGFAGGDDIAITRNASDEDAAWTFLKWVTRADVQRRHFGRLGLVPVRTDVALGWYSRQGEIEATLARALVNGRTVRSVQENALFNAGTSPWATMISQAVFGGGPDSVTKAVAEAQATMANILSRG